MMLLQDAFALLCALKVDFKLVWITPTSTPNVVNDQLMLHNNINNLVPINSNYVDKEMLLELA